jgi:hypothetical protein
LGTVGAGGVSTSITGMLKALARCRTRAVAGDDAGAAGADRVRKRMNASRGRESFARVGSIMKSSEQVD